MISEISIVHLLALIISVTNASLKMDLVLMSWTLSLRCTDFWNLYLLLQRNYRFFFMFVFSTTLLCIYVFGFCWVYIKRIMVLDDTTIWKAMIKTPASIVLIAYTFISVWFVGGLTAFHLYLISTNQVCSWIEIVCFLLFI